MVYITIYAYLNGQWGRQRNYIRPLQGEDKLDETLDSAITDFTLQGESSLLPFTKCKLVAQIGESEPTTMYFVVATPTGEQARMVE